MQHISTKRQTGFTLVEIAIVLVIIGLLLGGVLKGRELIDNSKVKTAAADINAVAAAYNAYIDRFRRIPGDDGNLAALNGRGGAWANVTQAGNSNRVLAAALNQTFTGAAEHDNFWQHLRAAGFISGDVSLQGAASLPDNAFGGLMGVTTANVNGDLTGLKACLSLVPGKSARALDTQLDDGAGATGSIRATVSGAGNTVPTNVALAGDYDNDSNYTVCAKL